MGYVSASGSKAATNICVVTENRLVRESLTRMLQKRADFCVGSGNNLVEVERLADGEWACDVLLTDGFGERQEKEALQNFSRRAARVKVVLFGMAADEPLFLEAVRSGVCGYLLNDASAAEIVAAVRAVCQGEAACSPKLCMMLMRYVAEQCRCAGSSVRNEVPLLPPLTARQLELVELVAEGMTNKEIAARLNLSEFTVKNHLRRIIKQTQAEDRHEVVRMVRGENAAPL